MNLIGKEILNYRITAFVGQGGMGSVYVAINKYITQTKAAIKVINAEMVNDFTRKRLKEEAERLAELNHQNIVKFQNYHVDDDGSIYLIMEYAEGKSLDEYISTVSGLIVEDRICSLFEPILDAIGYAHKHHIIHKDIKPSNIIITTEGIPKVLDFGIASLIKGEGEKESVIMGTPSYMSPEQVRGGHLDERSDIYSLGVLLHQMMTGNAPYDTTTLSEAEINKLVVEEPLPRMRTYYKYVSEKIQRIVDKATHKNPNQRFQTCAEFKSALHKAIYPPRLPLWLRYGIAALVFIACGISIWMWDYNRTKVVFYKDYVEQWGVPVGIHKLSRNEVSHRQQSYRFESSKGRVRRVSYVNSKGKIVKHHDSEHMERPSDVFVYYGDNGNVDYIRVLDSNGRVVYKKDFNDKLNVVTFQYDDEFGTELTLAKDITKIFTDPFSNSEAKGKISRYLLSYDENGFVCQLRYAGALNAEFPDANGIYGRSYKRDAKGRVLEEAYLSFDGSICATRNGLAIRRHTYEDGTDNWIETHYLSIDGKTGADENGTPRVLLSYDEYGNRTREIYVNDEGEPVIRIDMNCCGIDYVYDENGCNTQRICLGIDRQPCFHKDGFVTLSMEYDENGFVTKQSYFDDQGNLAVTKEGAVIDVDNDERGNILKLIFHDEKGDFYQLSDGSCGNEREYDANGNLIRLMYVGTDGKPCIINDGTSGYICTYDARNMLLSQTQIDTMGVAVKDINGISVYRFAYDGRGNRIEMAYFDETGTTSVSHKQDGISKIRWHFNEAGDNDELTYYDTEGKLCLSKTYHYARVTWSFDNLGNALSCRNWDTKGNLTLDDDDLAGYDWIRDSRGNILSEKQLGTDGRLKTGKLEIRKTYDERNNMISESLFDASGKPATNSNNCSRATYLYDMYNHKIETRYFDKLGTLVTFGDDKYAIEKHTFDSRGNRVTTTFFGKKEEPVLCNEGWFTSTRDFDGMNRVVRQAFFDLNRQPTNPNVIVPEEFIKYDLRSNVIYLATGDGHGNLIVSPTMGFAILKSEYDKRDNLLWCAFFNEKEQPMLKKGTSYHRTTYIYNEQGKIIESTWEDTKGNLVNGDNGYAVVKYVYNSEGRLQEESYYNAKRAKCNNTTGYHRITYQYSTSGDNIRQSAYLANGTLFTTKKKVNGQWIREERKNTGTGTVTPPQSSGSDTTLAEAIEQLRAMLPMEIVKDELSFTSVSYENNILELSFKLSQSKYDITEDNLASYKENVSEITNALKTSIPNNTNVVIMSILYDSKNRKVASFKSK